MKIASFGGIYKVKDTDDPISLTIIVGGGQIEGTAVFLGGKKIEEIEEGNIGALQLGGGRELKDKELVTKTAVADVNPNSNKTNVTIGLSGGVEDKDYHSTGVVDKDGDLIMHISSIYFIV